MRQLSSCLLIMCLYLVTGGNLAAQPAGNTAAVFVHAWLPEVGPLPHEAVLMLVARKALLGDFQAATQYLYLVPLFQHALQLLYREFRPWWRAYGRRMITPG